MIQYLLLILTLLLSACTRHVTTQYDIPPTLSGEQAQILHNNISSLLSNMDINEESIFTRGMWVSGNPKYIYGYELLSRVESGCVGRDFEEFRICLIDGLSGIRDKFDEVTGQGEDIDTYIDTIRREIAYMRDYEVLDTMPMPIEYYKGSLWDEAPIIKSCYSIITETTGYSGSSYYPDTYITILIDLGFQDTAYDELVSMFPSWSGAREIPLSREEYHCGWATFGPGYGTIFYAFEEGGTVYLFIKDADGAGSGDFNYSIFAYRRDTQEFIHLGSFYAYSGIIPLSLMRNNENGEPISSERSMILGDYRNHTFLYTSYIYEPMRNITTTIQSLLEQSIK